MKPEIAPPLRNILDQIGKPAAAPFVPDDFQVRALGAIKKNDCLVIAPTGSGKTWIAREAILSVMEKGGRAWYASLAQRGFDVYVYDQTGSGLSARLNDPRAYTVARHVADLEAIRQTIGAARMILIGDSWGATLAANYIAAHPDRV